MRVRFIVGIVLSTLLLFGEGGTQILEQEEQQKKKTLIPKAFDFSEMFDQKRIMTREDFELWKSQREARLKEQLTRMEALERPVDPEKYVVGPGDIFSFNIWGALEMQLPIIVSPEGKLLVPSVGEIDVAGKTLADVQSVVLDEAASFYENSRVTLTLDVLRFFRVHIVGEVQYPGTYIAQAVSRISEMITEAGGPTELAWKRRIELQHPDGGVDTFDLDAFEQEGDLEQDVFVQGGDVIYVPPIEVGKSLVQVKGDLETSGTYQILPAETLLHFLQRIRALKRNTNLSRIMIIRSENSDDGGSNMKQYLRPFMGDDSVDFDFSLQNGDDVMLPSNYVYVKGAVQNPGAYPYVFDLTAKDYAGMAGGNYRSSTIKSVKVYHVSTGKTEKGPGVLVEPGDVVNIPESWSSKLPNYLGIVSTAASLLIAAKAIGL